MNDRKASIRAAIESANTNLARELLNIALNDNPDADIYYFAAQVALSNDQKNRFMSKALAIDPNHKDALRDIERTTNDAVTPSYNYDEFSVEEIYLQLQTVETKIPTLQAQVQQLKFRRKLSNLITILLGGTGFLLIFAALPRQDVRFTVMGIVIVFLGSVLGFALIPRKKLHLLEAELEIVNRKRSDFLEQLGI